MAKERDDAEGSDTAPLLLTSKGCLADAIPMLYSTQFHHSFSHCARSRLVNLIERPSILETAIPHLIHRALRHRLVRAVRVGFDREDRSAFYTSLKE